MKITCCNCIDCDKRLYCKDALSAINCIESNCPTCDYYGIVCDEAVCFDDEFED